MVRFPLLLSHKTLPRSPHSVLVDTYGRVHNNLRISVTDRCNLRCTYCMPEEVEFLHRSELLSFEEIAEFVRVAAGLGIDKVRLTGGEPLLRRDLPKLVKLIAAIPGIRDIGLTTNGLLLTNQAQALFDAGLRRMNVSLDTLDDGRFRELSRRDGLPQVLAGLEAARRAGFAPIKVNAVAIRGFIEKDAVPLAKYCREMGFELRFIEYMPIGADAWEREKVFFAHELQELLAAEVAPLLPSPLEGEGGAQHRVRGSVLDEATPHPAAKRGDPLPQGERVQEVPPLTPSRSGTTLSPRGEGDNRSPAEDFDYADGGGRVGFIASVSRPFCGSCNRVRLTADGKLRNCLFAHDEIDVKAMLRASPLDDDALADTIRANIWAKGEGHEINSAKFVKPDRTMHAIGG